MKNIIKSLNMTEGAFLTLEKLSDRMEFEAVAAACGMSETQEPLCAIYSECSTKDPCGIYDIWICHCDCPGVAYSGCAFNEPKSY